MAVAVNLGPFAWAPRSVLRATVPCGSALAAHRSLLRGACTLRGAHASAIADPVSLASGVVGGNRGALSRAITLVESSRPSDRAAATALLAEIGSHTVLSERKTIRLGVTGPPGAGKSTFIEMLGCMLVDAGHRVAVLAIDPSSAASGGSILGDKTRMQHLSTRNEAYVRPSPTSGALGGVALRTHDGIVLCEAAGYDYILVETVGVGQSEVDVDKMVDVVLLLVPPGAGDGLQAIKRGLMELADIVVVTKADGSLVNAAASFAREFAAAVELLRPRTTFWTTPVVTCSNRSARDASAVLTQVHAFADAARAHGAFGAKRRDQRIQLLWSAVHAECADRLAASAGVAEMVREQHARVVNGDLAPRVAADHVCSAIFDLLNAALVSRLQRVNDDESQRPRGCRGS
mmetsp:Transcript_651/g.1755  ORF Transcript_651/g.1755 Transcript_651/m.1755 type:complete len:404 (+) Transcript_651:71-1282(+)